jgi:putative tryptophan/tyrosine transport system substrate-binding protein
MRRREFITLLGGGVAAWPLAVRAQQTMMPVVGHLTVGPPAEHLTSTFRDGLAEAGYVEGRNVVDYRHADNQYHRLPELAAELVRRPVSVIAAFTTPPTLAAKAATNALPIVFMAADDPVKLGLVASFAKPGGNATGVSFLFSDLGPKQLGLLRELVPTASRVGLLVNPDNANAEAVKTEMAQAAAAIGVQAIAVEARDIRGIEAAFSALVSNRVEALVVGTDPFLFRRRIQLTTLATRHACPPSIMRATTPRPVA